MVAGNQDRSSIRAAGWLRMPVMASRSKPVCGQQGLNRGPQRCVWDSDACVAASRKPLGGTTDGAKSLKDCCIARNAPCG
jgi:hypothetical protein